MAVVDLFSKRLARERGEVPDVYQYEEVPEKLRVQVVHIASRTLGTPKEPRLGRPNGDYVYRRIAEKLRNEHGMLALAEGPFKTAHDEFVRFLVESCSHAQVLDAIELLALEIVDLPSPFLSDYEYDDRKASNEGIQELNTRFLENGVGYQFENGQLVRIHSQFVHAEVVKPALLLLHEGDFKGAEAEFLKAHEHYRHGRHEEALTDCGKAFESTMKTICERQGWEFDPKRAKASYLLDRCLDNELVPRMWQDQLTSLAKLLRSSVPTPRNNLSAHGAGSEPRQVPAYIVSYALHMAASAIVFLVEAERGLERNGT